MTKLEEFKRKLPGIPTEGKQEITIRIEDVLCAFFKEVRDRAKNDGYFGGEDDNKIYGYYFNEVAKELGLE